MARRRGGFDIMGAEVDGMIDIDVQGVEEFNQALTEFSEKFMVRDMRTAVQVAGRTAMRAGASLAPPGAKRRELIPAGMGPRRYGESDVRSDKTDTSKAATHFVKFWSQGTKRGERVYFVPVAIGPRGNKRFDSTRDVNSLRKIGRRGWAALSFKTLNRFIGPRSRAGGKGGDSLTNWIEYRTKGNVVSYEVDLNNKLTYLHDAYPGIERKILGKAGRMLKKETEKRLQLQANKLQKKAGP